MSLSEFIKNASVLGLTGLTKKVGDLAATVASALAIGQAPQVIDSFNSATGAVTRRGSVLSRAALIDERKALKVYQPVYSAYVDYDTTLDATALGFQGLNPVSLSAGFYSNITGGAGFAARVSGSNALAISCVGHTSQYNGGGMGSLIFGSFSSPAWITVDQGVFDSGTTVVSGGTMDFGAGEYTFHKTAHGLKAGDYCTISCASSSVGSEPALIYATPDANTASLLVINTTGQADFSGVAASLTVYKGFLYSVGSHGGPIITPKSSDLGWINMGAYADQGYSNQAQGALQAVDGSGLDFNAGWGYHVYDTSHQWRRIGDGAKSITCTAGNEVVTSTVTNGVGIRGYKTMMLSSAGAVTVGTATTKPILPDSYDGHEITLINVGANNITLTDQGTMAASNLRLTATTVVLTARDSIKLTFSSAVGDWVQTATLVAVL